MGFYNTMRNRILRLSVLQQGKGLIKVNGQPLSLVQPEILRFKVCNLPFNLANHIDPPHWNLGYVLPVRTTSLINLSLGLRAPPDCWC